MVVRDTELRADRVAEVMVSLQDGGGRRGSGYLVRGDTVLTAAHVVADAAAVRVRFDADRPGERTVEAIVRWRHAGIDVAVLGLPGGPEADGVPAARFGLVGEHDAVLRCSVMGFPRFKLRTDADGGRYRDSEHVHGTCAVLSNRREGTFDVRVPAPADSSDADRSPWEGMSGAAVLSGGRIIGVVAKHHRADGLGRLAAGRVDRWAESLAEEECRRLEELLGCGLRAADLPDVVPPSPLNLIGAAYEAYVRDIAPDPLEGRAEELRRLVEFCDGQEPYLWVQAPPWAGKTALAAWFALHPPPGVVPVWFFATARLAGQADGTAYTEALVHQLAAIVGREPARQASPAVRDGERRLLLAEAADRVARDGGTLLLIVDGLDEDRSTRRGGDGPSIASLLPQRPPPNVRVLVSGRPGPGVAPDVAGDHPLRHCSVWQLGTAPAARHSEHEAAYDLGRALSDDFGRELVGLLAAALGGLTVADLHELTGRPHVVLRQRLGSECGRIVEAQGGDRTEDAERLEDAGDSGGARDRAYLLAHETLLTTALTEFGDDMARFLERIHEWADRYAAAGWPPHTPSYLLEQYGQMVFARDDVARTFSLASDVRRCDRLREVTGSDAFGLTEIRAALLMVQRERSDDLCRLAPLAALRDLVGRRNNSLPPQVPIAVARAGQTSRALGLADSVFRDVERARALAGVAVQLARRGHAQAGAVARKAVRLIEVAYEDPGDFMPHPDEILIMAATALMSGGHTSEALAALELLEIEDPLFPIKAKASLSGVVAARDAGYAAELLAEATKTAGALSSPETKIEGLAIVAGVYQRAEPARAGRLYKRVVRLVDKADKDPDAPASVLTAAAVALRDVLPDDAARFATRAVEQAALVLGSEEGWRECYSEDGWPSAEAMDAADELVGALVAAGEVGQAQQVAERWDLYGYKQWQAIAMGWAHAGRAEEAWRALERQWQPPPDFPWPLDLPPEGGAPVAAALAAAGSGEQAEAVARAAADRHPWAAAEALAGLAEHYAADDPSRARRLIKEAERVTTRSSRESADFDQEERFAALAIGLAAIGRLSDADRLIGVIGTADWRAMALAGVAVAHVKAASPQAPRLAREAADLAEGIGDSIWRSEALSAAAHALARTGALDRALTIVDGLQDRSHLLLYANHGEAALAATVAGLWGYDPIAAGELVDDAERRLLSETDKRAAVGGLSCLLAAVGDRDHRRTRRLEAAVRETLNGLAERGGRIAGDADHLALGLLFAADPASIHGLPAELDEAEPVDDGGENRFKSGALAIALAAYGGLESAAHVARLFTDPYEWAHVVCALAAYFAKAGGGPLTSCIRGVGLDWLNLTRRIAAVVLPPPERDSLEAARGLLAKALTTDAWHHAIPVLVPLEPDALIHIRDAVFDLLDFDDKPQRPHMGVAHPTDTRLDVVRAIWPIHHPERMRATDEGVAGSVVIESEDTQNPRWSPS